MNLHPETMRPPRRRSTLALAVDDGAGWRRLGSIGAALGISVAILFAIAKAQKTRVDPPAPLLEDLRAIMLPPPPPPPTLVHAIETPPPSLLQFDPEPSESPVKITPSYASFKTVARPKAELDLDFSIEAFRPSMDATMPDASHVFQKSEVDQGPVVLFRKIPEIPPSALDSRKPMRVTVLFVVNIDGSVEDVRVLRSAGEALDVPVVEAIGKWRFKPAVKKGRKVRCLIQQLTIIKAPYTSPFQVN